MADTEFLTLQPFLQVSSPPQPFTYWTCTGPWLLSLSLGPLQIILTFFLSLIHAFTKQLLLSGYYIPGTILQVG